MNYWYELGLSMGGSGIPMAVEFRFLSKDALNPTHVERCDFGHLTLEFLQLQEKPSRVHPLWAFWVAEIDGNGLSKPMRRQKAMLKRTAEEWLGQRDHPLDGMFLADEIYLDWARKQLRRVWLIPEIQYQRKQISTRDDVRRQVRYAHERLKADASLKDRMVAVKDQLARASHSLVYGYGSTSLIALIWVELMNLTENHYYFKTCPICGQPLLTRLYQRKYCDECKAAGRQQRKQREDQLEYVASTRRERNRDRMNVLRGKLPPEDFIRKWCEDYTPRRGSELHKVLLPVTEEMVRYGELTQEQFASMFPAEPTGE